MIGKFELNKFSILTLLFLSFFIFTTGCSSNDFKIIHSETYLDSNITYSNFSCQTDVKFDTLTKYYHTCSFDITDKMADENSTIEIDYSYCYFGDNCFGKDRFYLKNFRPGELYHYQFKFEDTVINRLSTSKPKFEFKAMRTIFYEN